MIIVLLMMIMMIIKMIIVPMMILMIIITTNYDFGDNDKKDSYRNDHENNVDKDDNDE